MGLETMGAESMEAKSSSLNRKQKRPHFLY